MVVAYAEGGVTDLFTQHVRDWPWLIALAGAVAFVGWPVPLDNELVGTFMLCYCLALVRLRLAGSGDIVPFTVAGFALGLWMVLPLLTCSAGLGLYLRHTRKQFGPALPFLALGVFAALLGAALF